MALLKDLVVTGASRYIGDAYFNTIKSGTWNGSVIGTAYGGLGRNCSGGYGNYYQGIFINSQGVATLMERTVKASTAKYLAYYDSGTTVNGIAYPSSTGKKYLEINVTSSGGTNTYTYSWVTPGSLAGNLSQLKFSKTPITGDNASKNVTFYKPDAEKTISYDTILPELGVRFLEANFFKFKESSGSANCNIFLSKIVYVNPYFTITTLNASGVDTVQSDWLSNQTDTNLTAEERANYGVTLSGLGPNVVDPGTAWSKNGNNRFTKGSGSSKTTSGLYCELPSDTATTAKITRYATINVKYGGAIKSYSVSFTFIRPVFVFGYSGVPDSTFVGTMATKSGTSSFDINNTNNTETVSYKVLTSLPNNTQTGIKIDNDVQQRVWILIPCNSGGTTEFEFKNLKDGMGNNALDATYNGTSALINNSKYGYYKVYASGTQACGLTPNMFINKS